MTVMLKYSCIFSKILQIFPPILFNFKRGFLPFMRVPHAEGVYDQNFYEKT